VGWVVNATPRPVWTGAENFSPLGFDPLTVYSVGSHCLGIPNELPGRTLITCNEFLWSELFSAKLGGVAAGFGVVDVTVGRAGTEFKPIGLPRVLYGLFRLFVLCFLNVTKYG
jgi:hypothetical protein